MTDAEKSEILHIWHVCDVENVAIYAKFIAIYAVLLQNLLFTLFCREISCGEKLSPKEHLWRKNDKYEVWRGTRRAAAAPRLRNGSQTTKHMLVQGVQHAATVFRR